MGRREDYDEAMQELVERRKWGESRTDRSLTASLRVIRELAEQVDDLRGRVQALEDAQPARSPSA